MHRPDPTRDTRPFPERSPLTLVFLLLALGGLLLWAIVPAQALIRNDIFSQFSEHIRRQVDVDKLAFATASECTHWFYKREREKPSRSPVQGIAWRARRNPWLLAILTAEPSVDCPRLYPEGLASVREDFSRTQSSLSFSLTFYEFALVGDKDDDRAYSDTELRDVLQSLEVRLPDASHLRALTEQFDVLHRQGNLDQLMTSMGLLYEKGYRFSDADKAELSQVMQ